MSYIRKCKYCNAKISIREMPDGQWVAFEYQTDTAHECYDNISPKKNISSNNQSIEFLIKNSISNKEVLFLRYRDIKKSYSDRTIEPIFLHEIIEEGVNKSILEAFCRMRQNKRHFRLDRIIDIRKTNDFFSSNYVPSNIENIFEELPPYSKSYKNNFSGRSNNIKKPIKNGCLSVFLFMMIITSLYFITNNILYALLSN